MAPGRMVLPRIDRELDFYELAVMTGIRSQRCTVDKRKETLDGPGANITVYDTLPSY